MGEKHSVDINTIKAHIKVIYIWLVHEERKYKENVI